MSELLNKWVARISKAHVTDGKLERGKIVGTGFISVYPWLITCNHVVADCIGKKSTDMLDAGEISAMVIDFPLYPGKVNNLFQAEIVVSKPKLSSPKLDDIHDVAILKLKLMDANGTVVDDEWASEWKYEKVNYEKHKVSAKGFFIEKASLLEGESITSCTDGLIELDLDVDESIGGASGSPVWSKDEHAIIGMLSSQRGESAPNFRYKKVYMIPMHKILDACQEHKSAILAYKERKFDFDAGGDAETFLASAKGELVSCLSADHVKYALNDFLKKQQWDMNLLSDANALCERMLIECPRNAAKIYRDLTICTRESLKELERGEHYKKAKYLIEDMKKIISLLSLYVLKKENITQLRQDIVYSSSSVNLTVAHETLGSAELVSAARMQANPRFRKHEKRPIVLGQYAVSHFDLEIGIGKKDNWIDEIGKKVWRVFFENKYDESSYSRQDLSDHIRRELCANDPEKINCYLVVSVSPQDKNESPLLDKSNRQKFKEAFPELPIIILDNTNVEAAYVVSDRDLMVELYKFLDICERYDNRTDRQSNG